MSPHLDIIGALLILGVCVFRDFLGTVYMGGEMTFGNPLAEIPALVMKGGYPLGILATVGAIFSMLATRFTGKQNNLGNFIGTATTVNSGVNDFLFGNLSAVITYPITFVIFIFASYRWHTGEKIKKIDTLFFIINILGLILGYFLVWLGFSLFGGAPDGLIFHTVSITFGLSLGANASNALKYEETWLSWSIYNVLNLVKNIALANIANVVKYIFYFINAIITLLDWKWNGDKELLALE